jgi:hypothetical protein
MDKNIEKKFTGDGHRIGEPVENSVHNQQKFTGDDLARMMPDMVKGMNDILNRSEQYLKSGKKY